LRISDLKTENIALSAALWGNGIKAKKPESGSNANGSYKRYPRGEQTCWGNLDLKSKRNMDGTLSQVLPARFSDQPTINIVPDGVFELVSVDNGLLKLKPMMDLSGVKSVTFTAKGRYFA